MVPLRLLRGAPVVCPWRPRGLRTRATQVVVTVVAILLALWAPGGTPGFPRGTGAQGEAHRPPPVPPPGTPLASPTGIPPLPPTGTPPVSSRGTPWLPIDTPPGSCGGTPPVSSRIKPPVSTGSTLAVFVLVHGAWQGSWAWYRVKPLLEALGSGRAVVVPVQLPAHGTDTTPAAALPSLAALAAPVLAAVRGAPRPVVLVGHSLAGALLSTVAEAAPDKISKLVYLAAFLLPNNTSILDVALEPRYACLLTANLRVVPEAHAPPIYFAVNRSALVPALYGNCPREVQQLATLLYRDDVLAAFTSRIAVTQERWGRVARYYVYSDNDNAIVPQLQKDMVASQGVNGTFFIAGSDHEPHLSKPKEVARVLSSLADITPGSAPCGCTEGCS